MVGNRAVSRGDDFFEKREYEKMEFRRFVDGNKDRQTRATSSPEI